MMGSRRSVLWKYFIVCEDDESKAECTCIHFLFPHQQLFVFVFGRILQWTIRYSAKYWKPIFCTAL